MEEQPDGTVHFKEGSKYEPAVGDVVEYQYGSSEVSRGIVFGRPDSDGDLMIAKSDGEWAFTHVVKSGFKAKIGHVENFNDVWLVVDAIELAKAYFSKPTFTGTYEERQKQWVEYHGLTKDSEVKVVRKFKNEEDGSDCWWWAKKEDYVGRVYGILVVKEGYIEIDNGDSGNSHFPYFALEPVNQ